LKRLVDIVNNLDMTSSIVPLYKGFIVKLARNEGIQLENAEIQRHCGVTMG
jgi:hypothetical protein